MGVYNMFATCYNRIDHWGSTTPCLDFPETSKVTAEPVVDTVAVDPPAAAPAPAAPAPAAPEEPPVVKRFPAGSKVTIKGLTGGDGGWAT